MYTKSIHQNTPDSHQTAPGYVLTFVRFSVRDSLNTAEDAFETRQPLVVYNDATSVQVNVTKASKTPTISATLMGGDINYSTAIAPGDFVFCNMVDWESEADNIAVRASQSKPINGIHDGFKGLFRVQSVTRNLVTNEGGTKSYYYTMSGAGFSEFDTTIVYNPAIQDAFPAESVGFFMTLVGDFYTGLLKSNVSVSVIIQNLFKILIGKDYRDKDPKINNYGNLQYRLPQAVGALLGVPTATHANQIYNLITGVWGDSSVSPKSLTESQGFNPSIVKAGDAINIFQTNTQLQGAKFVAPENWNYKTVWSILNDNLNSVLNEMYTCYRVAPNSNSVMPTVIARQKPFTTPTFVPPSGNFPVTRFLQLPRWVIEAEMVKTAQFYRNEALRVNFVQVYTRGLASTAAVDMALQVKQGNFVSDSEDIQRHGMKPYIVSSNFDFREDGEKTIRAKEWSQIVSDWVINGHLKEAGTLSCVGIQENIAVGDNIEFDGVVYHIEGVTHHFEIMRDGKKQFHTQINVSYGIDKRSSKTQLLYSEMQHVDRHRKAQEDYEIEQILPGISDAQDITGSRRFNKGEEVVETAADSFQIPNRRRVRNKLGKKEYTNLKKKIE